MVLAQRGRLLLALPLTVGACSALIAAEVGDERTATALQ
jgi:hypothetical protein